MPSRPLISCVMVTADRPELCRRAIISYNNQTYPNKELIVLDNGTKDMQHLLHDVPENELRYAHRANNRATTIGELRNLSLEMVRGDVVVPQWDDDDWSAPERLDTQYKALVENGADAVTLYATLMHVDDPLYFNDPFYGLLKGGVPPTVMHKRDDSVRFPELRRTSDTHYKNVWRQRNYLILPMRDAHLHLRYFHGTNLWEQDHFLRRMRNTPQDLVAYGWWKFVRKNIFGHPRFRISAEAKQAFQTYLEDSKTCGLFKP